MPKNTKRKLLRIMKIVICDDNYEFLQIFRDMLETQFALRDWFFDCREFQSGQELLNADLCNTHAVFLDIDMPGLNGLQVARNLRTKYPDIIIVFVTAFSEYAPDGYETEALRYLLKNNLSRYLPSCLDAIRKKLFTSQDAFLLRTSSNPITVRLRDIMYFEATRHANSIAHIYPDSRINCLGYLSEYEDTLSEKGFLRIQRSYLVNSMYIADICNYIATLKNGETLSISRKQYKQICAEFMRWKGHYI